MNYSLAGLETLSLTIDSQVGLLNLSGKIQLPEATASGDQASQVVCTVIHEGTTVLTTTAGSDGFSLPLFLTAGDTLSIALSSSFAPDEVLGAVRAVISLG